MVDYKIILGIITIIIGVISYSFYFRDILKNKTKPEAFSWLIWGLLATITFFAQASAGGGFGTWATAFTAVVCLVIAVFAFSRGDGQIKTIDIISLFGALMAIVLWKYTNDPLIAVLLVVVVGALGFVPTFQKAFTRPREETAITFSLNALKFAFAFAALGSFTLTTWLYPVSLVVMNTSLAMMIFLRR